MMTRLQKLAALFFSCMFSNYLSAMLTQPLIEAQRSQRTRIEDLVSSMKSIDDIADVCAECLQVLNEQTFFPDKKFHSDRPYDWAKPCVIKHLSLPHAMAKILEHLSLKANVSLETLGFQIISNAFNVNSPIYEGATLIIHQGKIDACNRGFFSSLSREVYISFIEELKQDWFFSTISHNPPNITYPENEWYLFIKKKSYWSDAILLRFIASIFKIKDILCDDEFKNHSDRNSMYLWIKKNSLEEISMIFKFNFLNLPEI